MAMCNSELTLSITCTACAILKVIPSSGGKRVSANPKPNCFASTSTVWILTSQLRQPQTKLQPGMTTKARRNIHMYRNKPADDPRRGRRSTRCKQMVEPFILRQNKAMNDSGKNMRYSIKIKICLFQVIKTHGICKPYGAVHKEQVSKNPLVQNTSNSIFRKGLQKRDKIQF